MPLPPSASTGIVRGKFTDDDGDPSQGKVYFVPPVPWLVDADDNVILELQQHVAVLDSNGEFVQTLIATDDPDLNPVDWTWTVRIDLVRKPPRHFGIYVPSGSDEWLADITPGLTSDGVATGVPGPPGPPVADGDKGDIAVSGGGAIWTLENIPSLALNAANPFTTLHATGVDATDTAAIQAAVTAIGAAGGGELRLKGDFVTTSARITVPAGVTIRCDGDATITSANANGVFEVTGASDVWIEDLTIVCTGAIPILFNPAATIARAGVRRCRISGSTNNACRVVGTFEDFAFERNTVSSCAAGLSVQGTAGSGLRVVGNTFREVGLVNLQVYGPTLRYTDVLVADNVLRDFDTPSTAIPIEVTGCTNGEIRGNLVGSVATRGVSTATCDDLLIADNVILNQTIYAFEVGNGSRVSLIGNHARNCRSLFFVTNGDIFDLSVVGNTYSGSGLSGTDATAYAMSVVRGGRILIADNVITDWQYATAAIRVGNANTVTDCTIRGNEFYVIDANTLAKAVNVAQSTRCRVVGNKVVIGRNLAAADDFLDVIGVASNSANNVDAHVERNDVIYTGTVSAATNHNAIGHRNVGAGVCAGLRIIGNKVTNGQIGIYSNTTSTDAQITDNETRTCATTDTIPTTLAVRRSMREHEAAAAPTSGTWRVGDRVWNTGVAAGGVPGWICTTAGTPGTWKAMAAVAA